MVGKLKHRRGEGVRAKIKNAGHEGAAWRGRRVGTIRLFAKRRIVIAGLVIRWGGRWGGRLVFWLGAEEAVGGHAMWTGKAGKAAGLGLVKVGERRHEIFRHYSEL